MQNEEDKNSLRISNEIAEKFSNDPNFPYLISFPRTGSHWLRMLMELYFEKPSLVRAFYYFDATDFTCYHRHDEDLSVERQNVIYLYRDPSPTIYSQMQFYNEDINNKERIKHWATIYGQQLNKWLFEESFTTKKTIITYEGLKNDLPREFEKICLHLNTLFDKAKLDSIQNEVTKEKLKKKTKHDPRVLNLSTEYEERRKQFMTNNRQVIMDHLAKINSKLPDLFKNNSQQ